MATSANIRRVFSLSYGDDLEEPVGARFTTRTVMKANKPGIIITDECLAYEDVRHEFEFKFQGIITPPTPGDKFDAEATLQTYLNSLGGGGMGSGGLDVTLPDALFSEEDTDFMTDPGTQTIKGRYVGTSLQPRTVG